MTRRMTAARRRALRKAQLASARKRKGKKRAKDSVGYWIARGVKSVASTATFGVSGVLSQFGDTRKGKGRIGRIPISIKSAKRKKK